MSNDTWMIESFSNAVHGAKTHWSACNVRTGKRIEADSRRELMAKIGEVDTVPTETPEVWPPGFKPLKVGGWWVWHRHDVSPPQASIDQWETQEEARLDARREAASPTLTLGKPYTNDGTGTSKKPQEITATIAKGASGDCHVARRLNGNLGTHTINPDLRHKGPTVIAGMFRCAACGCLFTETEGDHD